MKIPLTVLGVLMLTACANHSPVKYASTPTVKTVKVKCHLPPQPAALAKPLPMESPKSLVDKLTIKLVEWVDYGAKVKKVC